MHFGVCLGERVPQLLTLPKEVHRLRAAQVSQLLQSCTPASAELPAHLLLGHVTCLKFSKVPHSFSTSHPGHNCNGQKGGGVYSCYLQCSHHLLFSSSPTSCTWQAILADKVRDGTRRSCAVLSASSPPWEATSSSSSPPLPPSADATCQKTIFHHVVFTHAALHDSIKPGGDSPIPSLSQTARWSTAPADVDPTSHKSVPYIRPDDGCDRGTHQGMLPCGRV